MRGRLPLSLNGGSKLRPSKAQSPVPRFLVDLDPLRRYRDLRWLSSAQVASFLAGQVVQTAVPYELFVVTGHSTVQVGLLSIAQLVPSLVGTAVGGMLADAHDRRNLMAVSQFLQVIVYAGLIVVALLHVTAVWPLYLEMVVVAAVSGLSSPAQMSAAASIVAPEDMAPASALFMLNINVVMVAGPALGGLLIGRLGFGPTYDVALASSVLGLLSVLAMRPIPAAHSGGAPISIRAMAEGLSYLRKDRVLFASFALDFEAMVFGMPRVAFPALAVSFFHGGAATYGLLVAAPGAGAIVTALVSGWTANVRRAGLGVVVCVFIWGASIALVGIVPVLGVALTLLAVAGGADLVSGVFRNTILQTTVPDALRGRLTAVLIGMANGGNRVGDAETGGAAAIAGARFAVWSGGLACILGAIFFVVRVPSLLRYDQQQAAARLSPPPAVDSEES
jgi:predicted MFS family arabinose efflux permease